MPAEIDVASSGEVSDVLASVTGESPDVITADLTGTRFCDSAGVRVIARAWERIAASGAELRLVIAGSPVAGLLRTTGLDQLMPVYPDVQQSLEVPPARPTPAEDAGPGADPDRAASRPAQPAGAAWAETQDALLPGALPVLPRASIAAHSLVAGQGQGEGVAWFDAITLPDGSIALVAGDVPGTGITAAGAAVQLRAVLSEPLLCGAAPAAAITRADAFAQRSGTLRMAPVVLAVLDLRHGTLHYLTCGHQAPVIVTPGGTARHLPSTGTSPLGTGAIPRVASTQLRPGDLVLLYSDGLAAPRLPDRAMAALAARAGAGPAGHTPLPDADSPDAAIPDAGTPGTGTTDSGTTPAERLCVAAVAQLAYDTAAGDVTAVAAQWTPAPVPGLDLDLPAETGTVRAARRSLGDWLSQLGPLPTQRDALLLAASELTANAVEHAYPAGQPGRVELHATVSDHGDLVCRVVDHGHWQVPGPGLPFRGHGLTVAARLADKLRVEHPWQDAAEAAGTRGTVVTFWHRLSRPASLAVRRTARQPAGPPFGVHITPGAMAAQATVQGPLDASTADRLAARLLSACGGGTVPLTVDLPQVSRLTSAAVRVLYRVKAQLNAHRQELTLRAAPGSPADAALTAAGLRPVRLGTDAGR
jgi:anti-anti-sigma factor